MHHQHQPALEFDPAGLSFEDHHSEYPPTYASSSGSFSTASTVSEAFTPPGSGRSTPKKRTPSSGMDFDMQPIVGYQTPPASAGMPGYFPGSSSSTSSHHHPQSAPHGLKSDMPPHMFDEGMMTPSRKPSIAQPQQPHPPMDMDFDQQSYHQATAAAFQHNQQQHQPQQHPSTQPPPTMFPQYQYASSFQSTTPYVAPGSNGSFSLDGSTPEVPSSWSCFDDASAAAAAAAGFFDSGSLMSPTGTLPSSHPVSKRLFMGDAQSKTTALRQAQYGIDMPLRPTDLKRPRGSGRNDELYRVSNVIERGTHHCDYPGCNSRPFKRQEHLKRHKDTKHNLNGANKVRCVHCDHVFNRRDNYRQHLLLHVKNKDKPAARTKWHPDAQPAWDRETSITKTRSRTGGSNGERSGSTSSTSSSSSKRGKMDDKYRRLQHPQMKEEDMSFDGEHMNPREHHPQQQLPLPSEMPPPHHLPSVMQPQHHPHGLVEVSM